MRRDEINLPEPTGRDRPSDRWVCSRLGEVGACHFGPGRSGRCSLESGCQPKRSWAGRRRLIAIALVILLPAVIMLAMYFPVGSQQASLLDLSIKPGALTNHHAQILATTGETERCIQCHPSHDDTLWSWLPLVASGSDHNLTQTDLCLNCHQSVMAPGTESLAHNLTQQHRSEIRLASSAEKTSSWHDWLPSPAIDQEQVACNACHREHQGENHNLSAMSDSQCQTCHQDRFGDFATSHPEFDAWPYQRSGTIAFSHRSHQNKHFPESNISGATPSFQCSSCHQPSPDGKVTRAVDFQNACASCHSESLETEISEGIELVSMPTLPRQVTSEIPAWPESATGFPDGRLSPLAELLIRGDSAAGDPTARLRGRDFSRIDPSDRGQNQAAGEVASELVRLLHDLADNGQRALLRRLTAASQAAKADSEIHWRPIAGSFPPQLVDQALGEWFQHTTNRSASIQRDQKDQNHFKTIPFQSGGSDDLLAGDEWTSGDDLLADDDLLGEDIQAGNLEQSASTQSSGTKPRRFNADSMLVAGGWYRDDVRLAIRYRPSGHADPVLKAMIDAAALLPASDRSRIAILNDPSAAACIRCHASAAETASAWKTQDQIQAKNQFTKFSHAPHLNIASLADCAGCHQVESGVPASESNTAIVPVSRSGTSVEHHGDFKPMKKQDCAACHTKQAAGDSCVSCHRYHLDLRSDF